MKSRVRPLVERWAKELSIKERSGDLPWTTGEEAVGRASQVREIWLIQRPRGLTCPISCAEKFDTTRKEIIKKRCPLCFCFPLFWLRFQLYLEIDFSIKHWVIESLSFTRSLNLGHRHSLNLGILVKSLKTVNCLDSVSYPPIHWQFTLCHLVSE